ncbi:putative lipase essential for disintegration of autophagic bodies inside the vacuole [Pseudoloma neurophilia]|uniref:triacylglycerol lipase n=1 Tax=Pseudoloma neurophilia TaxID=146866 RepID=A0A0R0LZS7_9MICR|nr:putative lipase essential for disintegration of autophagic bodies inside the vacuole [Pseudoloma neurophilia]
MKLTQIFAKDIISHNSKQFVSKLYFCEITSANNMRFCLFALFCTVFCNIDEILTETEDNDTGIKRFLEFLIGGLKNIARIGRIFKMNKLFFRDPQESLQQFKFSPKERKFIRRMANLAHQTYSIGDFEDVDIESRNIQNKYNSSFFTIKDQTFHNFQEKDKIQTKIDAVDEKIAFITDSLKGIIYTSGDTTVIAFKGTSLTFLGIDSSNTSQKDRIFDNIIFDCKPSYDRMKEVLYIDAAQRIYDQVKQKYPKNKIVLTGHSMGAAIASIIGHKNQEYVLAFASPGDQRIITALELKEIKKETKSPRTMIQNLFFRIGTNIIHIGDCSDAIYRGACNGSIDVCKIAGYNIKTRCHTGRKFCLNKNTEFSLLAHPALKLIKTTKMLKWDVYEINQTNCSQNECRKDEPAIFLK